MSGSTLRHAFTVPAKPAEDCQIIVDQVVIDALWEQILVSQEDSLCWVDDSFEVVARNVYEAIGTPSLDNLLLGWKVFASMAQIINVSA